MPGISLLSRYIATKLIGMILATFMLCAGLIFMIDFIEVLRQSSTQDNVSAFDLVLITLLRLPAYSEILLTFAVLVGSIATFLMLARQNELAVIRAGGLSVWAFLRPAMAVAILLGIFAVAIYNPLAAQARELSEKLQAQVLLKGKSFFAQQTGLPWLRQDGLDGPSVLTAQIVENRGLSLSAVQIFQYDKQNRFIEKIDGRTAVLKDGFWAVREALVTRPGERPVRYAHYLVSTYLNPERVTDALGSVMSLSFWELPGLIETIEKSGLSASGYRVQYHLLLSRPLLLVAMVLLAATVSLRSFRSGGIQTMVVIGMMGGIGFFLMAEVSRQVGAAGLVAPWVAAWVPVCVGLLGSTTFLLHQEDG